MIPHIAVAAYGVAVILPISLGVPSLAQQGPTVITRTGSPRPVPDRAAVAHAIAMAAQTELSQTPVSCEVTDAGVRDIAVQLEGMLPGRPVIEVRTRNRARFTFSVKNQPASKVLRSVARRSGCNLIILSDHWLLATEAQLAAPELSEARAWRSSALDGNPAAYQAMPVLVEFVTSELLKTNAAPGEAQAATDAALRSVTWHYSDIKPDLQQLLQQLVAWRERRPPGSLAPPSLHLTPATVIGLDYDAEYARLEIKTEPGSGGGYVWESGESPRARQQMRQQMEQARAAGPH